MEPRPYGTALEVGRRSNDSILSRRQRRLPRLRAQRCQTRALPPNPACTAVGTFSGLGSTMPAPSERRSVASTLPAASYPMARNSYSPAG